MKNKKIFSPGLYLEGIRQLRLFGILSTVILLLFTILKPVFYAIEYRDVDNIAKSLVSASEIIYVLPIVYLLLAPFAIWLLFKFLNDRATADFYHSIPHTRTCLFISLFLSALTWIVFMLLINSLAGIATYSIFSKYYLLDFSEFPIYLFSIVCGVILSMGITLLAMTITGTTFSNLVITCLIMFAPRIYIYIVSLLVVQSTKITELSGFASPSNNMITGFFYQYLSGTNVLLSLSSSLYSLVLGLLYLLVAGVLFHFRKSEIATKSAPNSILQAVYRIAVTMCVSLIPLALLYELIDGEESFDYLLPYIIISSILAILVYFIYEIITTKKLKNCLHAVPGLGIVILLNLAVLGGMFGARYSILSFQPTADQIKGIYYQTNSSFESYLSYSDYVELQYGSIELKSDKIKEVVAEALAKNAEAAQDPSNYYSTFRGQRDSQGNYISYYSYTFQIVTKTGRHTRTILLDSEQAELIENELLSSENVQKLWMQLPDAVSGGISIEFYNEGSVVISDSAADTIYSTFKKEVATLDAVTWKNNLYTDYICTIRVTTRFNNQSVFVSIPISYSLTPQTVNLILNAYQAASAAGRNQLTNLLQEIQSGKATIDTIIADVFFFQDGSSYTIGYYYDDRQELVDEGGLTVQDDSVIQFAQYITSHNSSDSLQYGDDFAVLFIYYCKDYSDDSSPDFYEYDALSGVFFKLDEISLEELKALGVEIVYEDSYLYYSYE